MCKKWNRYVIIGVFLTLFLCFSLFSIGCGCCSNDERENEAKSGKIAVITLSQDDVIVRVGSEITVVATVRYEKNQYLLK